MKNYKKKLSFLLAAIPLLSNASGANAMNEVAGPINQGVATTYEKPGKPMTLGDLPFGKREQDVDAASTASTTVSENNVADTPDEQTVVTPTAWKNLAQYATKTINDKEKDSRSILASEISERLSEVQKNATELVTDMTVENYSSFAGSEFTSMLSSMQSTQDELDVLATSMQEINNVLNSSDRFKVDSTIMKLDEKVTSFENLVNDTKNRAWPALKKSMIRFEEQKKQSSSVRKAGLIRSCKAQCVRTRSSLNDLENSLQIAVNMDPAMDALYAHIRESVKKVINDLNHLDSQLANTRSLTIQTLQSMKESSQLCEDNTSKLKADFGKIQAKSNSDSYANVLTDLGARVMKTELSCENVTRMNIRKRTMSDSQRQSLLQVKEELKKLFDSVKQEIQAVRDNASASRSLSKAMPTSVRRKLEDLVSETLGESADHIRTWGRTIAAIESDDELRSQWNPQEMHRIMKQRMTRKCYDILTNNSWNISKKVKAIVAEINNVQPGTGTMVESVVRGILEYLSKGTPLTSVGEAVKGNLSGRSWMFTGEGGTGKSTAAELLAAAFNVKLVSINGGDLQSRSKVARIIRDLTALTKPQTNPENLVNFMVLIDEVDTGTCIATDYGGRTLNHQKGNAAPVADDYDDEDAPPVGSYADVDAAPSVGQLKKWTLKTRKVRNKGAAPLANRIKDKNNESMDTTLLRNPDGFGGLSKIYELLDRNTQSNMWGFFSTSNFNRQAMPEEVARRLSPDTHEVAFRKPLKKEFIEIINKKMPNLSFSDGYDKSEGAAKIAEQAEKNGLSAAELLSTITPIANAVRKPGDTSCALPAIGICQLLSGSITEGELISDARRLNYEEESNKNAGAPAVVTNEDPFDDPAIAKPYEDNLGTFAPGIKIAPPQS